VRAAVDRLRDERLEPRADLPRRQVAGRGDELDPERHGSLAAVAQLEHGAAGQRAVVDVAEDAHLVEVEHHLELGRRQHLQPTHAQLQTYIGSHTDVQSHVTAGGSGSPTIHDRASVTVFVTARPCPFTFDPRINAYHRECTKVGVDSVDSSSGFSFTARTRTDTQKQIPLITLSTHRLYRRSR